MATKEISIVLRAKNAMAAGLSKAKKSINEFGEKVGSMAKTAIRNLAALAATVGGLGAYFVKASSDAAETGTKFDAVFSSIVNKSNNMADSFAKDFGLAGSSARKMMGDTGDLLVGFGMTENAALEMSDKVARLSVDLASFTNFSGGASGASQALTKALLGETESAKSLGIVIRQNTKEFRDSVASTMAAKNVNEQQAKAMVILEMAMAQTTKAHGDYERTQDGVANKTRLIKERFKEFREAIGDVITEQSGLSNIMGIVADKIALVTSKVMELSESGAFDRFLITAEFVLKETVERVKWFGESFKVIMQNAFSVVNNSWENTTDTIGYKLAEIHAKITGQEWNLQPPKMRKLTDGLQEIPQIGGKAYEDYQRKLSDLDAKIEARTLERLNNQNQAETEALENSAIAAADAAQARLAAEQQLNDELKKLQDEREKAVEDELKHELNAAQAALAERQKIDKERQKLAAMRVNEFIAGAKKEKDTTKEKSKEAEKAARLEAAKERGAKLSKGQEEFLDAFNKIKAAQDPGAGLGLAQQAVKDAQKRLEELQGKGNRLLADIDADIKAQNTKLDNLLAMQ